MKKEEAVDKTFNDANYQTRSESDKEKERIENIKDSARPALLKRIGAGLLDFLFSASLFALLFVFSYFVIFPSLGYQDSTATIMAAYSDSGLYAQSNGNFVTLDQTYNSDLTPEENYDVPITNFYKTNARAIEDNKLESYEKSKVSSGYFVIDGEGNIVRKEGINNVSMKSYLEGKYEEALDYLFTDPDILNAYAKVRTTMLLAILINMVISVGVFYFIVPLIDKDGCTFGYLITRIIPVRSQDTLPQTKGKLMFRAFIFVTITYLAPLGLFILANGITFAFIPFFANTVVLCFTHSNSGLHDYATKTTVLNRSRTNAMEILKQLKGEDNYQ